MSRRCRVERTAAVSSWRFRAPAELLGLASSIWRRRRSIARCSRGHPATPGFRNARLCHCLRATTSASFAILALP